MGVGDGDWSESAATAFRSTFGSFTLRAFEFPGGVEHAALLLGDLSGVRRPLVRLQSSCLTGTAFGALLCDCRAQLEGALELVRAEGGGCVIYLDQEGRGHGLVEKVRQLDLITSGLANTATAAGEQRADMRSYDQAASILREVASARALRLLTNNPKKVQALEALGFEVERVPLEVTPTPENQEYLRVKKELMGHLLTLV